MKQRPYQTECLSKIGQALENGKSTLAVMATGLGKTVVLSHLAKRWPGRVLVLAHRDELIRQASEKLLAITGEEPGIEMGEDVIDEHDSLIKHRLVVSSVQTMSRPRRQQKFDPSGFGLLVIDEAHHAPSRTYRNVISYFQQSPTLRLLGVTATPKRADDLALGQVFDSVCYEYGIEAAIDDGWLVPVSQQAIAVEGLDFSKVRSMAGDLNEGELEAILKQETILHATAAPTVQMVESRPTLVFCVTVAHAHLMAEILCRYKERSAVALDGETPKLERRKQVDRFRAGEVQFLCSCGLFLEGFDAPTTSAIIMARPTKSISLYTQILGRGTRPLPGIVDGLELPEERRDAIRASGKPNMLVLDFVGNSGRHKLINATDLLGGKYAEPVRAYARQNLEQEGKSAPVGESLDRAAAELSLLAEIEERKRREKILADATYESRDVDPFAPGGGPRIVNSAAKPAKIPPTDGQVWFLVHRLGWSEEKARGLSRGAAGAIIGKSKSGGAA